jgi:hypothetical protein
MSWDNENYRVILGCKDVKPELYSMNRVYDGKQLFDIVTGNKQMIEGKMNSLLCMNNLTKLNGKILIQCDVEVEKIYLKETNIEAWLETKTLSEEQLREKSCLRLDELYHYLNEDKGYAIHFKNIDILEKPRDVSECDQYRRPALHLKHLPRNMCECYNYYGWWNILITLTPKEMCNVLNGKQTIIVRKEILEERLKDLIEVHRG